MPEKEKESVLELFGLKIPLPKPAKYLLSLVAILAVGLFFWMKIYRDPERQILNLQEVQRQLATEVEEYGLHVMEKPEKHEVFEDSDGHLALRVYKDHCLLIQRQTRRGVRTKLILDLAREARAPSSQVLPPVYSKFVAYANHPCQRGCMNPHPGDFEWWYGAHLPSGWIEVWRRWKDGCTHVQLLHPSSRTWDSNPDGSPKVRWTCCVH